MRSCWCARRTTPAIRIYTTTDLTAPKLFYPDARCTVPLRRGAGRTTATTSRATRPSIMRTTWILANAAAAERRRLPSGWRAIPPCRATPPAKAGDGLGRSTRWRSEAGVALHPRTAPSRRRCATSCRALSLTTAPWRAAAARPSARRGGWTTVPRISAPVICWWSALGITMPTTAKPSAMSRRMPSARACAPSGTLPATTARCASCLPVAMRGFDGAGVCHLVLPPTARRCAPLPPSVGAPFIDLAPLPPPPTPPLALSAARPAICGWAQSRTTPTSKTPAPAARHRLLCSSFCRIPPRHWMCCGRISNKF